MNKSAKKVGKENHTDFIEHVEAVKPKSNGQIDTEGKDSKTDEKQVAVPVPGWSSISSSSVKKPPTNAQVEKNKMAQPKPQQKQTQHLMEHAQKPNSGKSPKTIKSPIPAKAQNNKQTISDQQPVPVPTEPTPPKLTGPSYADIARSNSQPQQVQQAPQSAQPEEHHVKSD